MGLTSLVQENHSDPFFLVLNEYKQNKSPDKSLLETLLSSASQDLHKLFIFAIAAQDKLFSFQDEIEKALCNCYPPKTSSAFWLCYFINDLLGKKISLDPLKNFDYKQPKEELLSFVLSSLLYAKKKEKRIWGCIESHYSFCRSWYDHNDMPLLPIWSEEKNYSSFDILCCYFLFFLTLEKYTIIDEKKDKLLDLLSEKQPTQNLIFYLFIEETIHRIDEIEDRPVMDGKRNEGLVHHFTNSTFFATAYGKKSSLGMAIGNKVEVSAFGPQSLPLDDSNGFGVYTPYFLKNKAIVMEKKSDGFFLDGWISLAQKKKWGKFSIQSLGNCLDISFSFFDPKNCGFAFYIKAKFCDLFDKRYQSNHLCHETKEVKEIFFGEEDEKLKIQFNKDVLIEVITLPGKSFFWEANFLLFIHCHKDEKISATLSY